MQKTLVYFDELADPASGEAMHRIPGVETVRLEQSGDEAAIWSTLARAHGYQCRPSTETEKRFWPGPELIERCPNLLAVSSAGAGYDMVDVAACTKAGILVVNQSGANAESVAQHVIGMALSLCKQMIQSDRAIRRPGRDWSRWDYVGHELTGRTIGIVGLGNIGRRVVRLAKAFNMETMAFDPYISDDDFRERGAAHAASLEELFTAADVISINCPLTAETRGMVGADLFRRLKPTALFITTARGGIHDEMALAAAIAEGRIAGAGCDVFEAEPPDHDHPLLAFDNVIVSPHNAGVTLDANVSMSSYAVAQWAEIFAGRYPPRLRNPEVWDRYRARFAALFGSEPAAA
ncbi:MAG: hydroxyacid dehydrogenase [Rhodospirillaceae bacterium]